MVRKSMIAAGFAMLALAACGRDDANNNVATDNGLGNAAETGNEAKTATAPAAADFATAVAASDLYEIESGRLAAEKASSAEVKSFAQMLVTDHQKSTADLKAAAGGANPPVTVSPALDAEKQAMIDALKSANGAEFDRTFIDQQKQAHQKALDLLRGYDSGGDARALKDFAAKAATVVQGHLDRLNQMQP